MSTHPEAIELIIEPGRAPRAITGAISGVFASWLVSIRRYFRHTEKSFADFI